LSDYKSIETWFSTRFENLFKYYRSLLNIPSVKIAKINTVGTGVASVYLPNDPTNIIPNIKIGTNVSVTAGDSVFLLCMNGNIGNSYILTNLSMASTSGGGTITNASNIGTGGISLFASVLGSVLQFYKLRAASSKATVAFNAGTNTVDIDVSESNLTLGNMGGKGNLSGTTNQVNVSGGTNAIIGSGVTLSLPQNIHTSATPTFQDVTATNQLKSTAAIGTAPLVITSTTKVSNLNVEQVDGYDVGHSTGQIPVSDSSVNATLYAQYTQERLDQRTGTDMYKEWHGTAAQYTAIGSKDAKTTYYVSG